MSTRTDWSTPISGDATALAQADSEVTKLQADVAAKRQEVEGYRLRNNIVSLERSENEVLARVKNQSDALGKANERLATAEGNVRALTDAAAAGKIVVRSRDNPTLANIEQRVSQAREDLHDLERSYTPEYLATQPQAMALRRTHRRARPADRRSAPPKPAGRAGRSAGRAGQRTGGCESHQEPDGVRSPERCAIHDALQRIPGHAGGARGPREGLPRCGAAARAVGGQRARAHAEPSRGRSGRNARRALAAAVLAGCRDQRRRIALAGAARHVARGAVQPHRSCARRDRGPGADIRPAGQRQDLICCRVSHLRRGLFPGRRHPCYRSRSSCHGNSIRTKLLACSLRVTRRPIDNAAALSGLSVEEAIALRGSDVDLALGVSMSRGASPRDIALGEPLRDYWARPSAGGERILMTSGRPFTEGEIDAQILCAAHDARLSGRRRSMRSAPAYLYRLPRKAGNSLRGPATRGRTLPAAVLAAMPGSRRRAHLQRGSRSIRCFLRSVAPPDFIAYRKASADDLDLEDRPVAPSPPERHEIRSGTRISAMRR